MGNRAKEKLKSIEPPWTIVDIWRVLKEPQEADLDRSGSIRGVEVFVVAIALSLDSLATGIGTTFTELPIYVLGLMVGIFQVYFYISVHGRVNGYVNFTSHISLHGFQGSF